jgi:hypothetical protein
MKSHGLTAAALEIAVLGAGAAYAQHLRARPI